MRFLQPNVNKGITDEKGNMLQAMRLWIQNVTRTQLFRGTGSPDGILEAVEDAQYVDTITDVMYYKKFSDINGDTSRGWVAANMNLPLTAFGEVQTESKTPHVQLIFPYNVVPPDIGQVLTNIASSSV